MKRGHEEKQEPTIRSGAAESLTFVAATGQNGVNVVYAEENVWLSQKMMAKLYDVDVRTINEQLKKIFPDKVFKSDFDKLLEAGVEGDRT